MRARGIPADPQAAATWFARAAAAGAILLPDACLYLTVPDEARWSRSHARVLATAGHLDRACKLAVAAYDIGHQYESERVQQAVRSSGAAGDLSGASHSGRPAARDTATPHMQCGAADRTFQLSSPQRWDIDAVRRGQATATMGHRCCGNDIHGPPLRLPGPAEAGPALAQPAPLHLALRTRPHGPTRRIRTRDQARRLDRNRVHLPVPQPRLGLPAPSSTLAPLPQPGTLLVSALATGAGDLDAGAFLPMVTGLPAGRSVAPSTRAIIRSRKVSPGSEVIWTTIRSDRTTVPPVTAHRSPPDSLITGADSPVIADSSTVASPSITSPSPGMTWPAWTTTWSPTRRQSSEGAWMLLGFAAVSHG